MPPAALAFSDVLPLAHKGDDGADAEMACRAGGPVRAAFNRIRKEKGLKDAIAWRDARYRS
jgi:hypothetical protein